jgi:hypothetical protein
MDSSKKIIDKLSKKAATKQEVFRVSKTAFNSLKEVAKELSNDLESQISPIDKNVEVKYTDKGEFEIEIKFSCDTLIFHMHTNTFSFDKTHQIWNSKYVKEDKYRAYCGVINVYNFLSDSFKYHRENDLGFLTDGTNKMGFLYNDFEHSVLNKDILKSIIEELMLNAMDFELITPPFKDVQVVSVHQVMEMSKKMKLKTSKKLGYRLNSEK